MQRHDVQELQSQKSYPCVSVLLPVFAGSATDRQQTQVRFKNLLKEAEQKLARDGSLSAAQITPLLRNLESLIPPADQNGLEAGMAIFANPQYSRAFSLPFTVEERVVVNHQFATREVMMALAQSPRYRVLALTEKCADLYHASRDHLTPAHDGGFPHCLELGGVKTELPGTYGVEPSALRDAEEKEYLHRVVKALCEVNGQAALPLVVAGVERTLKALEEAINSTARHQLDIVGRVHGGTAHLPVHVLGAKCWAAMQENLAQARQKAQFRLEEAIGPGRAALGLESVWHEARKGRVDTLLLEEGFQQPAVMKANGLPGGRLETAPLIDGLGAGTATSPRDGHLPDAVEETMEVVLHSRGEVVFLPPGELTTKGRIAAILRY